MIRETRSRIDAVRHDIIECNTVFNRAAYEFGKVLLMKYSMDIPGMQMQRHLFEEPYQSRRNSYYESAVKAFQEMLRKYRTDLEDIMNGMKTELSQTKQALVQKDDELEASERALRESAGKLEETESELFRCKAEIKTHESTIRSIRQELDDIRREYRNLQDELTKERYENKKLQEEIKRLLSDNEALRSKVKAEEKS